MNEECWNRVNLELIAKAISELTFEEILHPKVTPLGLELQLQSKVTYQFNGEAGPWGDLRINPESIRRNEEKQISAAQFFLDSQNETGMTDLILANFLEEMHNTLYSDMSLLEKRSLYSSHELSHYNGEKLQSMLNGHPKILLNKGRMGWGQNDLMDFAPESEQEFQLHWIAVHKSIIQGSDNSEICLKESFNEEEYSLLFEAVNAKITNIHEYSFLPVHPWQWDRYIRIQFSEYIAKKLILSLGKRGDFYRPQISLRTLSNSSRPGKLDIKLPLTILNTSCVRGIPAKSINLGMEVSQRLKKILTDDAFLMESGTNILEEKSGLAILHSDYQKINGAPYRYHEFLGAIWRENAESKLEKNEMAILAASLAYQDMNKKSLIGNYIKRSGLSPHEWLKSYFEVAVLPLYHLQLVYGIGLVAHGQNIVIKLKDYRPVGIFLKDFQGDFRISDNMPIKGREYFENIRDQLTQLPPHYLIHDLLTGHFITVLRFLSRTMSESDEFDEKIFYSILSEVVRTYSVGKEILPSQDLLMSNIPKLLLNKVRFNIGYNDTSERPLPLLGTPIQNPLLIKEAL